MEGSAEKTPAPGMEPASDSQKSAEAVHSAMVPENPGDAYIKVSFSENDLEAWGDFVPAVGNNLPLTEDYIRSLLEKLNIVYGVQQETIDSAMAACNGEKKNQKAVLLARGTSPQDEIAGYVQINPQLGQSPLPQAEENARIDHRAYTPFIIVKKGQALAKQKSPKPGINGTNVHAAIIPYKTQRPLGVEGGDNTRMEGRYLLASISGQMVEEKRILHVRESLTIKGPVGYRTGNISFPGDVIIDGPVSDGFKIYSGGSVTIKQTFDVTDAITKGDLVVTGGIIGRGRALVKTGGRLETKFIENCRIAARKTISVTTEIINSHIYTLEQIEMGDKGKIVGGEIYAVRGIRANSIGKISSRAAKIHCGIDFTLEQEKEITNNTLRLLAAKLERLKQLLEEPAGDDDKKAKLEELQNRLEAEQRAAAAKVSDLMGRLVADENAAVEVSGEIAPGTFIEICQVALFVTEPLKKVRIILDRAQGKLTALPL